MYDKKELGKKIADAMEYKLKELIDDDTLMSEMENGCYDPENEVDDNRKEIEYAIYEQQSFHPEPSKNSYYEKYPIKTLQQFLLYLPLMDEKLLYLFLQSLKGGRFGNESDVLDKLRFLYRQIPESNAKRFADYVARKYSYAYYKKYHADRDQIEEEELSNPDRRNEIIKWHNEYLAIIEKKRDRAKENTQKSRSDSELDA